MPRYDYRCVECENEFELVQGFSDAATGVCPVCSGVARRVFHAVPVIYKGSGFYTTDYGRPKHRVDNGAKESSDTKATSGESPAGAKDAKDASGAGPSGSPAKKSEPAAKSAGGTSSSS